MTAFVNPDTLNQLVNLGVDRGKAHEALLKYDNDADRAADFCFQDEAVKNEWDTPTPREDSDYTWNSNNPNAQWDSDLQKTISASLESDTNKWAVVPYQENKNTRLNDQEQPIKRVKLDGTTLSPLGLRSIQNYGFAGSFFQALFHIPIFRLAILAYRPTRDNWSNWGEFKYQNDYQNSESRSRLKFMHEFQKLFGFLSLSQTVYGDASSLMDALDYEETKNGWGDWDVTVRDFANKLLDEIVKSSSHRDLIDLDFGASDYPSKYLMSFERLLKSVGRNEYQKNDEDVLCIPLDVTSGCNTVYAALDQTARNKTESRNVFFVELAKILILTLKHCDGFTDSGNLKFHIDKELYMDRYLLERAEDIEKRWYRLESLKSEFEKINRAIRKITDYQGGHSGLDLLKGSINYFRRKYSKARNIGATDDRAQEACFFLERALEKVENRLKYLIEERDDIEVKMRDIFDTSDMKKVVYRLKAVLGSDKQQSYGSDHLYAYIWVSRGSKTEVISSNNENGNWWKFCNKDVEQVAEEQVLKDASGNSGVYSLIYVNADVDYNFSNINDLIPPSLKEHVKKDDNMLDEEAPQSQGYQNYHTNTYSYSDHNTDQDTPMDNFETSRTGVIRNYDSTEYGGNRNDYQSQTDSKERDAKIDCQIALAIKQEKNMISIDPKINSRFEIFLIKLKGIDSFKTLMYKYYDTDNASLDWCEPFLFDTKYQNDPSYKVCVELFNEYKEITLYFTEGLERICGDEYMNALPYFKYAIDLEDKWIENIENLEEMNGERLQRSKEIDAYARACLKLEHEGFLGKIRTRDHITRGLQSGLQTLSNTVNYIGATNCTEDELFKQFRNEFEEFSKKLNNGADEEQRYLIQDLIRVYKQPKSSKIKPFKPVDITDDGDLCKRYEEALKISSSSLKIPCI